MKKALQISIAQMLFTIEEDAYLKLNDYLQSIRAHFAQTQEKEEIIGDIESRISEQFLEAKKSIITLSDVEVVIASMGSVEDFDDDEQGKATATASSEKKLYRNPDDKIIAGVCSGIGAYTNIDPLWVRIGFAVLTIASSGLGILAYVILALVIPEAKSASQKLEMQGSPVTLETMSESVKEKIENIQTRHGSSVKAILSLPFTALKALVTFATTYLTPFLRVCIGVAAACCSVAGILILSIFAPVLLTNADAHFDFPIISVVSAPVFSVSIVGAYLALAIPLIMLFIVGIGIVQRKRIFTATLGFTLLFLWCAAVVSTGVASATTVQRVEAYARTHGIYEQVTRELSMTYDTTSLVAHDGIRLTYVQGETPSMTVTSQARLAERLQVEETDGTMTLRVREPDRLCLFCEEGPISVTVTLPALTGIEVNAGSRIVAESWTSTVPVTIDVTQGSRAEITVDAPQIRATATYGSRLHLAGKSDSVVFSAKNGSRIDATEAIITSAKAVAEYGSRLTFGEITVLDANATEGARIEYLGDPTRTGKADETSWVGSTDEQERVYEIH